MRKRMLLLLLMMIFMVNTAYASELTWETAVGRHNQSQLLDAVKTSSKDILVHPSRGEYLSTGMLEIVNQSNGSIYLC